MYIFFDIFDNFSIHGFSVSVTNIDLLVIILKIVIFFIHICLIKQLGRKLKEISILNEIFGVIASLFSPIMILRAITIH